MFGGYEPAWHKAWASSSTPSPPTSSTKEPTERKTMCMGWTKATTHGDQVPGRLQHTCKGLRRHIRGLRLILWSSSLHQPGVPELFMLKVQAPNIWLLNLVRNTSVFAAQSSSAPISHLSLPESPKQVFFCPSYLKDSGPLGCYQMELCTETPVTAFPAVDAW